MNLFGPLRFTIMHSKKRIINLINSRNNVHVYVERERRVESEEPTCSPTFSFPGGIAISMSLESSVSPEDSRV